MCISRGLDNVTSYACRDDLRNNVFVGETDDETVLGGVVLVLVLVDQTDSRSVISLTIYNEKETTLRMGLTKMNRYYQKGNEI